MKGQFFFPRPDCFRTDMLDTIDKMLRARLPTLAATEGQYGTSSQNNGQVRALKLSAPKRQLVVMTPASDLP